MQAKRWCSILLSICSVGPLTAMANTGGFPNGPVRLVVPYAAGGPTDTFARALAESWGKQLGQTMIVENKTGAGTTVGTDYVVRAKPDGHTILLTTVAHAVNESIYKNLPYDTKTSLKPVGLAAKAPLVLLVNNKLSITTVPEFLAYINKNKKDVNYASAGVGSAPNLAGELLNHELKIQTTHVPYKGSAPALADLIGGHVDFMLDSAATGLAQAGAGTLTLLATTMKDRLPQTPNVPALAEFVPGYEAYTWNGAFVPKGTPDGAIKVLTDTLGRALQEKSLQEQAYKMGLVLETSPSAGQLADFLNEEMDKWGKIINSTNIEMK